MHLVLILLPMLLWCTVYASDTDQLKNILPRYLVAVLSWEKPNWHNTVRQCKSSIFDLETDDTYNSFFHHAASNVKSHSALAEQFMQLFIQIK